MELNRSCQWLTTFNLPFVIDPYTHESGWIIPRQPIFLRRADIRCAFWLQVTVGARQYLGKYSENWLVLTDEQREFVGSLSLDRLPALVHIGQDGSLVGCAEGWNPPEWKQVLEGVEARWLGGLSHSSQTPMTAHSVLPLWPKDSS